MKTKHFTNLFHDSPLTFTQFLAASWHVLLVRIRERITWPGYSSWPFLFLSAVLRKQVWHCLEVPPVYNLSCLYPETYFPLSLKTKLCHLKLTSPCQRLRDSFRNASLHQLLEYSSPRAVLLSSFPPSSLGTGIDLPKLKSIGSEFFLVVI